MALYSLTKKAISLRDEIGKCSNIKINIDVIDDSPFFVRPFPIYEDDKPINTTYTSPVMLVARKGE